MLAELVEQLLAQVDVGLADEVPEEVARCGELARRGYLWRRAETHTFAAARRPTPGLAERLAAGGDLPGVARALAASEPLGRPDPADGVASWIVPGPGGHVRHYAALASIERVGLDDRRLKRDWLVGFFYRCCEEERVVERRG